MDEAQNKIIGLALNGTGMMGGGGPNLLILGGRGRNRINNQTYFQQYAGQRMTP
jgi:hypothetical protein